jgi:hypothetical protein
MKSDSEQLDFARLDSEQPGRPAFDPLRLDLPESDR